MCSIRTYFFGIFTYQHQPIFANPENIFLLRKAVATIKRKMLFTIIGAVILPDRLHFIWQLLPGDNEYSKKNYKNSIKRSQN